jgi:nucleoside-diphosphate-sugar epimerase
VADWEQLSRVASYIQEEGGAEYVLHLAGYYDFSQKDHPAYTKTNVDGTSNALKLAEQIRAKRFFFSSSLAGCQFPNAGEAITEETPLLANFPYARSKSKAEAIIKDFSGHIPCTVIRLAAVFSDWCEYPPLYIFLETWLSKSPLAQYIGGKGDFAIPYIHIKDVIAFINHLIGKSADLPDYGVFIASQPVAVTIQEIYTAATQYYYNEAQEPVHLPRFLATLGLYLYSGLCRLFRKETFLQPWMGHYLDKQLNVDPSWTFETLHWQPRNRYSLLRRLLFLVENKIIYTNNWHFRNQILMEQRVAYRHSIQIYQIMHQVRDEVVHNVLKDLLDPDNKQRYPNYQKMDRDVVTRYIYLIFQLFALAIRNRDRSFLTDYNHIICTYRFVEGFSLRELKEFNLLFDIHLRKVLWKKTDKSMRERMNNYITLTTQYILDEREDIYETLQANPPDSLPKIQDTYSISNSEDLQWLVRRLEDVYGDPSIPFAD